MSQLQHQAKEREAETEAAILERAPAKSAFLEGVQSTFQPAFREKHRSHVRASRVTRFTVGVVRVRQLR